MAAKASSPAVEAATGCAAFESPAAHLVRALARLHAPEGMIAASTATTLAEPAAALAEPSIAGPATGTGLELSPASRLPRLLRPPALSPCLAGAGGALSLWLPRTGRLLLGGRGRLALPLGLAEGLLPLARGLLALRLGPGDRLLALRLGARDRLLALGLRLGGVLLALRLRLLRILGVGGDRGGRIHIVVDLARPPVDGVGRGGPGEEPRGEGGAGRRIPLPIGDMA
jgi:hypothetical protein